MFVHGDVTSKMLLMNTAKGTQEVTESGPHPFDGVGMNFSNAIAILVTRPFMAAMIDGHMCTRKVVVPSPLVSVDPRRRGGKSSDVAFERFAIRVVDHPQAHLPALPPNRADHRWTIIVIGAVSPVFVCPTARGIGRICMFFAFFPPHSETVHRSPLRDPAAALWTAGFGHWCEWPDATPTRCRTLTPVPVPDWPWIPPCRSRAITRPPGLDEAVCGRTRFHNTPYTLVGTCGTDTAPRGSVSCSLQSLRCVYLRRSPDISAGRDENASPPRPPPTRRHISQVAENPWAHLTPPSSFIQSVGR